MEFFGGHRGDRQGVLDSRQIHCEVVLVGQGRCHANPPKLLCNQAKLCPHALGLNPECAFKVHVCSRSPLVVGAVSLSSLRMILSSGLEPLVITGDGLCLDIFWSRGWPLCHPQIWSDALQQIESTAGIME